MSKVSAKQRVEQLQEWLAANKKPQRKKKITTYETEYTEPIKRK